MHLDRLLRRCSFCSVRGWLRHKLFRNRRAAARYDEHFARVGTGKGTGFNQYSRWLDFMSSRTTPAGDLLNITTLTFLRYNEEVRSREFAEARAAAVAAGIGTGNWRPVGPARAALSAEGGDLGRINAMAFDPRRPEV